MSELGQAFGGGLEGGFFFAKCEADDGAAVGGIAEEAGAGDAGYADFFYQVFCEGYIVGKTERGNIGHDVIRAARLEADGSPLR